MSTDQYRAGFEAWWEAEGQYSRAGGGDYEKTFAYNAWTASKREASTEPSAIPDVLFDGNEVYAEITRKLGKAHCHNHETVSATLDAVVRLMRKAGAAGALSDDAKAVIDAARKLVECKGRYHSELNFKALAAAVEAHKTGSGK
jgi:hypothetical protein